MVGRLVKSQPCIPKQSMKTLFVFRCNGQRGWFPSNYVEVIEDYCDTDFVCYNIAFITTLFTLLRFRIARRCIKMNYFKKIVIITQTTNYNNSLSIMKKDQLRLLRDQLQQMI